MKFILLALSLFFLLPPLQGQDTVSSPAPSRYKLSLSYGIGAVNPKNINDHISASNLGLGSTATTIKSVSEIAATFSVRPLHDTKILLVRGGYMSIKRTYRLSIPETINTPTPIGYISGSIDETYTAYPLSIGMGLASLEYEAQIQIEFIYGLGYIKEETSLVYTSGQRTSTSRTLFSPAYGFRIAGQATVRILDRIGLTFELGYRGLNFDEYEDETSTQPAGIEFSYSGINGSVGLSIIF